VLFLPRYSGRNTGDDREGGCRRSDWRIGDIDIIGDLHALHRVLAGKCGPLLLLSCTEIRVAKRSGRSEHVPSHMGVPSHKLPPCLHHVLFRPKKCKKRLQRGLQSFGICCTTHLAAGIRAGSEKQPLTSAQQQLPSRRKAVGQRRNSQAVACEPGSRVRPKLCPSHLISCMCAFACRRIGPEAKQDISSGGLAAAVLGQSLRRRSWIKMERLAVLARHLAMDTSGVHTAQTWPSILHCPATARFHSWSFFRLLEKFEGDVSQPAGTISTWILPKLQALPPPRRSRWLCKTHLPALRSR